jgi:hypothetical protein
VPNSFSRLPFDPFKSEYSGIRIFETKDQLFSCSREFLQNYYLLDSDYVELFRYYVDSETKKPEPVLLEISLRNKSFVGGSTMHFELEETSEDLLHKIIYSSNWISQMTSWKLSTKVKSYQVFYFPFGIQWMIEMKFNANSRYSGQCSLSVVQRSAFSSESPNPAQ